jgi:coproporphyrinogen III oxidase
MPIVPPGFEIKPWTRPEGGGGEMGNAARPRLREGRRPHLRGPRPFSEEFARQMPHTEAGASFWSAGVSVIIHPWNPNVPAAHMNTRMIVTGDWWFGGGGDLTPVLDRRRTQTDPDSIDFHAAYRAACEDHGVDYGATRNGATSTSSSSTATSRAASAASSTTTTTPATGTPTSPSPRTSAAPSSTSTPNSSAATSTTPWTEADRDEQLIRRGRYVEFNLLYDRGTTFGLKTGGNVEAILSSMPPEVRWP